MFQIIVVWFENNMREIIKFLRLYLESGKYTGKGIAIPSERDMP